MATKAPLYQRLACIIDARLRCIATDNQTGLSIHDDRLAYIQDNLLPHGSGFDSGTTIDLDRSKEDRVILCTSFHHMNDTGYYDGWTDHEIIVTPSLVLGYRMRVTGRNRNQIKNYIADVFGSALDHEAENL